MDQGIEAVVELRKTYVRMEVIRSLVRPVLTVMFAGTTLGLVLLGREVPGQLWGVTLTLVAFWFGERAKRPPSPPAVP